MTIINGIEIDILRYKKNEIKDAIDNNDPIENKLHVIAVVSNPCLFAKRYILMREFIHRMEKEENNVILYVVEMTYGNQKFLVTKPDCPRHLQLRTETPLWHKENMINLGVKNLLPKNYKAFAWIDADVEFENSTWAMDTLKILNGSKDIVQLFSHCCDMAPNMSSMSVFNSAGYQFVRNNKYVTGGINYSHPGFAWAMTRKAYERSGGLFDMGILGAGDIVNLYSLLGTAEQFVGEHYSHEYRHAVSEYQSRITNLRFGYVPGVIRHHFHGSKKNRQYQDRYKILLKYDYNPVMHVKYNKQGIIVPTNAFPQEFKDDIMSYFLERNEDEGEEPVVP